jgi:pimeloyl-ACP methyl ester carboxylesterase
MIVAQRPDGPVAGPRGTLRRAARPLAAVAALATAGWAWERAAERRDERALPPRGRFVTVDGRRVHVLIEGADRPGPTVVLEGGIGGATVASWGWVQPRIAAFAPVVAYDRAGLGWSDPGPLPRDALQLARELRATLAAVGLAPPYVIAGHSFGGMVARLFTHLYPREVAGLALVDASLPLSRPPRPGSVAFWMRRAPRLLGAAPFLARFGVARAVMLLLPTTQRQLPAVERAEQRAFFSRPAHLAGTLAELRAWEPLSDPEVAAIDGLGSRPVYVLTAGLSARSRLAWERRQRALAALSTDGVQETVPGAGHARLLHDPRQAASVAEGVRAVVEAVRSGQTLRETIER